jgi:hypothetical protein
VGVGVRVRLRVGVRWGRGRGQGRGGVGVRDEGGASVEAADKTITTVREILTTN